MGSIGLSKKGKSFWGFGKVRRTTCHFRTSCHYSVYYLLLCSCFRRMIDIHGLNQLSCDFESLCCDIGLFLILVLAALGLHTVFSSYHAVFVLVRIFVFEAFSFFFFVATDVLLRCSQRVDVCVWVLSTASNCVQDFFVCSAPHVLSLCHRCSMKTLLGGGSL